MSRFAIHKNPVTGEGSRRSLQNLDIVWSGDEWVCSKELKHYPTFCRNGTSISVYSFVWIVDKKEKDNLGYIKDLYEDQQGKKRVRVQRFQTRDDILVLIPNLRAHSKEVFIIPYEQDISAERVGGLVAILNIKHFLGLQKLLPKNSQVERFVCYRELRNNNVKPFLFDGLPGYSDQPMVSFLDRHVSWPSLTGNGEGPILERPAIEGSKKVKRPMVEESRECEPTRRPLRIKLPRKEPVNSNLVLPEPRCEVPFKAANSLDLDEMKAVEELFYMKQHFAKDNSDRPC